MKILVRLAVLPRFVTLKGPRMTIRLSVDGPFDTSKRCSRSRSRNKSITTWLLRPVVAAVARPRGPAGTSISGFTSERGAAAPSVCSPAGTNVLTKYKSAVGSSARPFTGDKRSATKRRLMLYSASTGK